MATSETDTLLLSVAVPSSSTNLSCFFFFCLLLDGTSLLSSLVLLVDPDDLCALDVRWLFLTGTATEDDSADEGEDSEESVSVSFRADEVVL